MQDMQRLQFPRRRLWKAVAGLGTSAGAGILPAGHNLQAAQVSAQNFRVITWKRFPVPPTDFLTRSTTWTPSNMPMPGDAGFVKHRSDSCLWLICNVDFVPTTTRSSFMGMYVDGKDILEIAQSGHPGDIQTASMSEIHLPVPAGMHQCQIYVAVEPASSCKFITTKCSFTVMEIVLPPRQT
jgi:hypothetical protein